MVRGSTSDVSEPSTNSFHNSLTGGFAASS